MKVLKKKGHEIHLRYLGYGTSAMLEEDEFIWSSKSPLFTREYRGSHFVRTLHPWVYKKVIKWAENEKFDVIHSVSMSDVLGAAAANYSKIPTLFDIRELVSSYDQIKLIGNYIPDKFLKHPLLIKTAGKLILSRLNNLERDAIELSKGRMFVSDYALKLAKEKYNFDMEKTIVLYNYLPEDDYPKYYKEKLSEIDGEIHIVYSSGLSMSDYRGAVPEFLKSLASKKVHVHIHGIFSDEFTKTVYNKLSKEPYIHLEKSLPPRKLITELTKYDYGLIYYPHNRESKMLHTSLPNKLFEYIAAGLPVIASSYRSMETFIKKYNVGITFKDIDELLEKIMKKKLKIMNPKKFVLENHIYILENLYNSIQHD